MREIKFRAWSLLDRNYVKLVDQTYMELFMKTPDTRPYIIMQYTGLKDKNGKEIYEGDIVKITALSNLYNQKGATDVLAIRFFKGNFCVCFNGNETGMPIYPLNVNHEIEIIGDIYNNPELLK